MWEGAEGWMWENLSRRVEALDFFSSWEEEEEEEEEAM